MKEPSTANVREVLRTLQSLGNPRSVEGMARYGINTEKAFGVSIPPLRSLAKELGKNHAFALELWNTDIHEARILASMVDSPAEVTEEQIERWVRNFNSWDLCDQCILNLFEKTKWAWSKAVEWCSSEEEFVKRAGFVMMARLAVSDKKSPDDRFHQFFPYIKRHAIDNRNLVKKAVNWALRQIGKRSLELNREAVDLAREIHTVDSKSARWIAADTLKELQSEGVLRRLKR